MYYRECPICQKCEFAHYHRSPVYCVCNNNSISIREACDNFGAACVTLVAVLFTPLLQIVDRMGCGTTTDRCPYCRGSGKYRH